MTHLFCFYIHLNIEVFFVFLSQLKKTTMTTEVTGKSQCFICKKETRTSTCGGCNQNFCRNDLKKHLDKQDEDFKQMELNTNEFKPNMLYIKDNCKTNIFLEKINQWEKNSIETIQQIAKDSRKNILFNTQELLFNTENQFKNLEEQLKDLREKNDFNELDLIDISGKFKQIKEQYNIIRHVSIQQQTTSFIDQIFVVIPFHISILFKIFFPFYKFLFFF